MALTLSDVLTVLGDGRNHVEDAAVKVDNAMNHFNFELFLKYTQAILCV